MERVVNCAICGRFCEVAGIHNLCADCMARDLEDFNRIRDFLYINPRATVFMVSTSLDIPVPTIKRYLREGRLEVIEKNNVFLRCEICGKGISSGTKCDDCQKQSSHDYKSAFSGGGDSKKQTKMNYHTINKK